jgi:hypothetical protein
MGVDILVERVEMVVVALDRGFDRALQCGHVQLGMSREGEAERGASEEWSEETFHGVLQ